MPNSPRGGGDPCVAAGCPNHSRRDKNLSFFRFPKEENRCKIWIKNCGKTELLQLDSITCYKLHRLCSLHFENEMFWNEERNRLLPQAIPTIFDRSFIDDYREATMDVKQYTVSADKKNEDTTTTNDQIFEEIYIKEEPLEENSQEYEYYENVLQSVKKEECISDYDKQNGKECENPINENNDVQKTENINTNDFCCSICNKSFTRNEALRRHMKIHEIKEHVCSICKKIFTRSNYLKNHMKVHAGIKKYSCPTCNKSFKYNGSLKIHMAIHSETKEYNCTKCNKQFTQSGNLFRHMKYHAKLKEYQCTLCEKSFIVNYDLKRHMYSHTGIKNYQCTICNKLFARKGALPDHMKIHAGIKNYRCSVCEKSFTQSCTLKRHLKTHSRQNNFT